MTEIEEMNKIDKVSKTGLRILFHQFVFRAQLFHPQSSLQTP
jgi:hypothetical protein